MAQLLKIECDNLVIEHGCTHGWIIEMSFMWYHKEEVFRNQEFALTVVPYGNDKTLEVVRNSGVSYGIGIPGGC